MGVVGKNPPTEVSSFPMDMGKATGGRPHTTETSPPPKGLGFSKGSGTPKISEKSRLGEIL